MTITDLIRLLRPQQWAKNIFIFLPLFFDRHLLDMAYLVPALVAWMAFSLASSGIYCLNDICDAEADRLHPKKHKRPIASGAVSVGLGYGLMAGCFCLSFGLMAFYGCHPAEYGIIGLYIIMNIFYCISLKHKAIVDVFIIAFGFVLRIFMGGFACNVWLSHWIVLMTLLLALFLAFAKRRDDVVMYEATGLIARRNVNCYNVTFMNQAISILAGITMMCYIMYTVSPEVIQRFNSQHLYVTSVFVLAGIIRYLQVTIVEEKSGSPTQVLLRDRFIQACIAGWILTFAILLYL